MSSTIASEGRPAEHRDTCRIRIAAAGDIHYGERADDRERAHAAFAALEGRVDIILLAGDLTTHGEPEQAAIVAEALQDVDVPVLAVMGNHDWHVNRPAEFSAVLEEAGVVMMDSDRSHHILEVCETEVGVAGVKGFMGGFPGSHLPDFGEPSLRGVYRESLEEAAGLDAGLRAIAMCPFRIVLMHYAPTTQTLVGERETIWTFLGTDRLPPPTPPRHTRHCPRRRSSSTTRTWSCTATRTRGPSRAGSARCRSTTSRCPCWARTSGSSSW